jgi:hypothetical protein
MYNLTAVQTKQAVGLVFTLAVLLTVAALPGFAAPASQTYQVSTNKNIDQKGQPVLVTATVKLGVPTCTYSVTLTVSGPGGVLATDTTTLATLSGGSGHVSATFPTAFSGVANTNTPGTYTVTAAFLCGYTVGTATNTFVVSTH